MELIDFLSKPIYHHIGGLESWRYSSQADEAIYHHIGGLEN